MTNHRRTGFQSMRLPGLLLAALVFGSSCGSLLAALQPGGRLTPYEIRNVVSGEEYCQICAYGAKAATVVIFGRADDPGFWKDLGKLEKLHRANPRLGVFAHILDPPDGTGDLARLVKHHDITFPVVVPRDPDWERAYRVGGISRTVYYARRLEITWVGRGLEGPAFDSLRDRIERDVPLF